MEDPEITFEQIIFSPESAGVFDPNGSFEDFDDTTD